MRRFSFECLFVCLSLSLSDSSPVVGECANGKGQDPGGYGPPYGAHPLQQATTWVYPLYGGSRPGTVGQAQVVCSRTVRSGGVGRPPPKNPASCAAKRRPGALQPQPYAPGSDKIIRHWWRHLCRLFLKGPPPHMRDVSPRDWFRPPDPRVRVGRRGYSRSLPPARRISDPGERPLRSKEHDQLRASKSHALWAPR